MQVVELIFVSSENNNKFYSMRQIDANSFEITYGRVGQSGTKETYPMGRWRSKYNEKIKKGYTDVTHLRTKGVEGSILFEDLDVETFYKTFTQYSKSTVSSQYNLEIASVTPQMIKEAQDILNELADLSKSGNVDKFNENLINLFKVIPRKIKNVKWELFDSFIPDDFLKKITQEQDTLDSLASQIQVTTSGDNVSINDLLGVNMNIATSAEVDFCAKIINPTLNSSHKIFKVFKVENKSTNKAYEDWLVNQDNKHEEYLIHGTRNANIFPILSSGLVLRPTNAFISGAAYGSGLYHSFHGQKSLGYTGYDPDKIFLIQRVHMGNFYTYQGWYRDGKDLSRSQMNYKDLKAMGYDSLYVKPGDGLMNSEYIVYNECQSTTNFLVWLKEA